TRTNVAVVIDDYGSLTRRTWKRPGGRLLEVRVLRAIVSDDRACVHGILHKAFAWIVSGKHSLAVAFRQLRNVCIHRRQHFLRHLLDGFANQRFATNNVEVLPVEPIVLPHELRKHLDLGVVFRAHDRIYVQTKTICVLFLQRIKRLDTVERLLPIAWNAADSIVSLPITVESDVQVEIDSRIVS